MTARAHPLTLACARARIEWKQWVNENGDVCFSIAEPVDARGALAGRLAVAFVFPGFVDQVLRNRALCPLRMPTFLAVILRRPRRTPYLALVHSWMPYPSDEAKLRLTLLGRADRRPEFRTPEEAKDAVDDLLTGADATRLMVVDDDRVWSPVSALAETNPDGVDFVTDLEPRWNVRLWELLSIRYWRRNRRRLGDIVFRSLDAFYKMRQNRPCGVR